MNKINVRIICGVLCGALTLTGIGAAAYSAGVRRTDEAVLNKVYDSADVADKKDDSADAAKDETVYVIAGADGSVQKVIVSDWIKNSIAGATLTDVSKLDNIQNVKGDEGYSLSGDNMKVWDAQGNDIYYQGDISQELPVNMTITYKLNGNTVSAEEIAGKSGKVSVRFDYDNTQYETVEIDGRQEKIYVPFVMLTGMILDNDNFRNIEVSNGKLMNDGDRTVIAGFALPGMQENLDVDKDKLEIPDYVEFTADVTDFTMETTVTVATNELFNNIELSELDSVDDLKEKMSTLTDAMDKLLDGSSKLYSALEGMLDRSGELISGMDALVDGAKQLSDGTLTLADGAKQIQDGIGQVCAGLSKVDENSEALNTGAGQVFATLLGTVDTQLKAAGIDAPALTVENYRTVLEGVIASLNEDSVRAMANAAAVEKVTAAVNANKPQVEAAVTAAVKTEVTAGVLAASGMNMTLEQYTQAVEAGMVPDAAQQQINAAVAAQMSSEAVSGLIAQNTEAQLKLLVEQNMASDEVKVQIEQAVSTAAAGVTTISAAEAQLDAYNEFYQGVLAYTSGVGQLSVGAQQLYSSVDEFVDGADTLHDGAAQVYAGMNELEDTLTKGVAQLADGAMQLNGGLKQLNEDGVSKLDELVNGDIDRLVARIRATVDVSKDYKSFSGISEDMDGQVRFIYRTAEVNAK